MRAGVEKVTRNQFSEVSVQKLGYFWWSYFFESLEVRRIRT